MKNRLADLGIDWFLPAILLAVLFAALLPGPGLVQEPVTLEEFAGYGVSGIFFFYGLKLNVRKLKQDLSNWKMHVLIQSITFVFFPVLILTIRPFFGSVSPVLWPGLFFLAALPSTVSSSVVMVSLAGGNIPGAIFNASVSALLGVFITPLWIGGILQKEIPSFDLTSAFLKLGWQVVLPVTIGILLNRSFGHFAEKHKKSLKFFDQAIILLIIYTSFCKSFAGGVFKDMKIIELIQLSSGMLLLFFAVLGFSKSLARLLNFEPADTITVMFCASKKSLVHGTVMAGVLFTGSPLSGVILLPIMLYHALQLVSSGILAKRIASGSSSLNFRAPKQKNPGS